MDNLLRRNPDNPILRPDEEHLWEEEGVFNGCPVKVGDKVAMVYRAVSATHYHAGAGSHMRVSDIGYAESRDGIRFSKRRKLMAPEYEWERFGCEDPRVTKLGSSYYIFYTALGEYPLKPEGIRVGVAITKDFKKIAERHLVTPFNAKAMALFPKKVDGKYTVILTANTDLPPARIAIAQCSKIEQLWSREFWDDWYASLPAHEVPLTRKNDDQIEVGAPPLYTKHGWLLIYCHIRAYGSARALFGIEAALLDLRDPRRVIARTDGPLLVPEEEYERYGKVPEVVFPSGALLQGDKLMVYYGGADTVCAVAEGRLSKMIAYLKVSGKKVTTMTRAKGNPILSPVKGHLWESKAVFNPAALKIDDTIHLLYRAMGPDNTSVFGYASIRNGEKVERRAPQPVYVPREDFEMKLQLGGNSGCEDPRLTLIKETIYLTYTAYDGVHAPRVAITSIGLEDFLSHRWNWRKPVLISPPGYDNKDAAIFPEKVDGRYLVFHRMGNDIDIGFIDDLDNCCSGWLEEIKFLRRRPGMWDDLKVGVAAAPVKTKAGWILLYHGLSSEDHTYRVGAVLLDLRDPTRILARSRRPIFEPQEPYEKEGQVPNVVFPCGNVVIGKDLYIYYGGADQVVCAAKVSVAKLLAELKK